MFNPSPFVMPVLKGVAQFAGPAVKLGVRAGITGTVAVGTVTAGLALAGLTSMLFNPRARALPAHLAAAQRGHDIEANAEPETA